MKRERKEERDVSASTPSSVTDDGVDAETSLSFTIGSINIPILFTGINTEQAHDISFSSLEVTLLNNVKLSRICRHFGFAMATGGRKPVACSKMLIFSHLVNFGPQFSLVLAMLAEWARHSLAW